MFRDPLLIHVPHASTAIPPEAAKTFVGGDLKGELLAMTDHYCDELFAYDGPKLVFPVSRLVCDPERFRDDADEPMAACGMGAVYTRRADGSPLRHLAAADREEILRRYYDPHHRRFTDLVACSLREHGRCLIVDGHSFPAQPLPYEADPALPRPDICIGADPYHTPELLTEHTCRFFREHGFRVAVNTPFAGSIVPLAYYRREKAVASVMIELNRRLYMDEKAAKTAAFAGVQRVVAAYLAMVAAEIY